MQTPTPTHEKAHETAKSRGSLGRRLFLAMLLAVVSGIVIGVPRGAGSETRPVLRGGHVTGNRQMAVAGALRLERPACPVPSRVGGSLHHSSDRAPSVALQ